MSPDTSHERPKVMKNTAVYVSNLPSDIMPEELVAHFSKCGIILQNFETRKPRIKIYKEDDGSTTALVIYYKEESVDLAISILDESHIRGDCPKIRVEKAEFRTKLAHQLTLDPLIKKRGLKQLNGKLRWD